MAFTDHMSGLLHRQGIIQGHRLLARTGASPCGTSGKTGQTYPVDQQTADAGSIQGKTAQSKDAGAMYRVVYAGDNYEMVS